MNICIMGILKEIRAGGVNIAKGYTAPPFALSLLLLVVVCEEWGISNMKLNYLSAAALH